MPMQSLAIVLLGRVRGRRRGMGFHLPAAVGRAQSRAAHGQRRQDGAGGAGFARQPEIAPRRDREHPQGIRGTAQEIQARPARGPHRASRADLVEAEIFHHFGGDRPRLFRARHCSSTPGFWSPPRSPSPAPSACRSGCCRSSRSGAKPSSSMRFPDAVDIIVRGVKAGLPLLDCAQDDHHRIARSRCAPNSAPSSRRRPSACRSARLAPSFMSACRCRRRTSSAS